MWVGLWLLWACFDSSSFCLRFRQALLLLWPLCCWPFIIPSAASLTPCLLTPPSSASSSALSFPSRSTCDGTFTHSCSALLLSGVSYSCCHSSKFFISCPFFVFHPLLRHPSSHSVAPSVTSRESTHSWVSWVSWVFGTNLSTADSSARLLVCTLPSSGSINIRVCPSPNQEPYPTYCLPSSASCGEPSVHTVCSPSLGGSRKLHLSMASCFSCFLAS